MAGSSKRSLIEKLGIKPNTKVLLINSPKTYNQELTSIRKEITLTEQANAAIDFAHFFTKSKEELVKEFPKLAKNLAKNGQLWISWPKGTSKIPTDLNENIIREIGLENGLVDVKVIAVDEIWSGLKFIYRLKDR